MRYHILPEAWISASNKTTFPNFTFIQPVHWPSTTLHSNQNTFIFFFRLRRTNDEFIVCRHARPQNHNRNTTKTKSDTHKLLNVGCVQMSCGRSGTITVCICIDRKEKKMRGNHSIWLFEKDALVDPTCTQAAERSLWARKMSRWIQILFHMGFHCWFLKQASNEISWLNKDVMDTIRML